MASVLLIRHGQASFGTADYDRLSDVGQEQSRWLGRWFKHTGNVPDLIVVGPLHRHAHTADLCVEAAGISAPRIAIAGLDEFDHEEILARHRPDLASHEALVAELATLENPHRAFQRLFSDAVARWTGGAFDHEYSRSWPAFRAAVMNGMEALAAQQVSRIWAFTSGGPIAVIANALVGAPMADTFSLSWPLVNTSTSRISIGPQRRSLISYNGWPHLEGADAKAMVTYR
jgi:broad specificity phosphatase PhoE